MRTKTKFTVRIFLGDTEIEPSQMQNLIINSKTIDRIINDIVEQNNDENWSEEGEAC